MVPPPREKRIIISTRGYYPKKSVGQKVEITRLTVYVNIWQLKLQHCPCRTASGFPDATLTLGKP